MATRSKLGSCRRLVEIARADRPDVARLEAEELTSTRAVKGCSATRERGAARHVWHEGVARVLGRIRGKRQRCGDSHDMTAGTARGEGGDAHCGGVAVIEVAPQISCPCCGIGGELLRPSR